MSRAKIVVDGQGRFYGIRIDCPAGHKHVLPVDWTPPGRQRSPANEGRAMWAFNGDLERPTLSPSVLMRRGHYANPGEAPGECACDFQERFPDEAPWPCVKCHSFVRDGRIEFLSDCTHALAGQTVDLPELDQGAD